MLFCWQFQKKLFVRNTIKPGTPEHRTTEHGTPAEHRINDGILTEHQNSGGTIQISQKSGTIEHQHSNGTTKQHQEELPIQNDKILCRQDFFLKCNLVRRQFPCNKFARENEK